MEPNHLLAIGLGNVHRKIDNLKQLAEQDISNSYNVLNNSLTSLSSHIVSEFSSYDIRIGNFDSLSFKTELGNTQDIISALNYLDSNKVHFDLATEIQHYYNNVITFTDKDLGTDSFTVETYTKNFIDDSMNSLYTDLNKCCVNVMGCGCYNNSVSIIYGDSEYFYINKNDSSSFTFYYIDGYGQEQFYDVNNSLGCILDPKTNKQTNEQPLWSSSYCIHVWSTDPSTTSLPTNAQSAEKIHHKLTPKIYKPSVVS